ncbi:FKBP-type peptidyl-prolyl cis-trans isomerase [Chitinophaga rhizophila]|uniref:Peptidyl-prolyl cis-trans isomerase n=1 Tax=Chitinophaga rhizophila TaxID=2866212 RepID=A0ABS7GB24_9BACT|nr:FKBP-type peptidyl-prolyl cis-trans isomerase [Chitinophaga rhizophila]MBW8684873.1 FKBP-type peptidyl-prolyl cis-trans isomerase [Chitinophaga rhizophila]
MNLSLRATFYLLFSLFVITSCSKSDDTAADYPVIGNRIMQEQDSAIRKYMADNNLELIQDFSGIYYKIEKPGDPGAFMTLNSIPTITYTRRNLKDSILDASFGSTDFDGRPLKDHIMGWQVGLRKIGKGGKIFLIIPSPLGFGNVAVGNIIPANSVLVCDMELVDFK